MTWTNLPVSHPSQQPEMLGSGMAVDSIADPGHANNEDSEMLPCKPDPPSTPERKGTQVSLNSRSSQKDPLPIRKLGREEQNAGSPDKVDLGAGTPPPGQDGQPSNNPHPCPNCPPGIPPSSPDPISPVSAPAESVLRRLRPSPDDLMNSDPITATPPSQRKCNDDSAPTSPAALQHQPALPEGRPTNKTIDKITEPVSSVPLRNTAKPTRSYSKSNKGKEPLIHAALKKSSTLSVNDNTEICIDITGDQEAIEQEGSVGDSGYGTESNDAVPARFATLAPFLNASEKWFSTFDPNLKQLLATRAQQLAIHCKHFSSLNAALYILSKGPWIPTHISVHVRQAALAAVGVGWSWVNQVPTAFPFSHFDASVSLATLDDIPTNETTQVDAVFAIYYATACGNLSPSTRAFLFTKYEYQCNVCARQLKVPIDLFIATVSSSTTIEDVLHRMTPVWNRAEIKEKLECRCLELEKASSQCLKLGPVVLIRLQAGQGETLPNIEDGHFPLGHQFSFQTRTWTYEIRCLVTTNRMIRTVSCLSYRLDRRGVSQPMIITMDFVSLTAAESIANSLS